MNGHGEKLSRKQEQAILALLSQPTLQAASQGCGVSESTLGRWMRLPDFQNRYREARREMINGAIANLQQASGEAVNCLRTVMRDAQASASSRAAAAKTVLEFALKATEFEELEQRVLAIEEYQRTGVAPNSRREVSA